MPQNFNHVATTSSSEIPLEGSVRTLNITNLSANVVFIRVGEEGSALVNEGVCLPFQYSTFSYNDPSMQIGTCSVISVGGDASLSIFAS